MNKKGFTLVELMVVIVIIGVLAAVAIPKMMSATNKAKAGEGPQVLRSITNMEAVYSTEAGSYRACDETSFTGNIDISGWTAIGFEQPPRSKIFKFKVEADNGSTFTATAKLDQNLGNAATSGDKFTVNEKDFRDGDDNLFKLVPNWAKSSTSEE